jgi:hypothetical protein
MQIIKNWINGNKNFIVGKVLYNTLGTDESIKNLLNKGQSPISVKVLFDAMEKLQSTWNNPEHKQQTTAAVETAVMEDSSNNILQALKNEWLPLYQKMNLLRHQLDKDFNDINCHVAIQYRKPIAHEILALEQECIAIWKKRDYYLQYKKLPNTTEKKLAIPTDPIKLAKLIDTIKKNIRRNRKLSRDFPKEPKYAQAYNNYKIAFKTVTGNDYTEKN